jgi:hypothetical protein
MWLWRHYWNDQVGMVKMAFSSTFMMAAEGTSLSGTAALSWLDLGGTVSAPTVPSSVNATDYPWYAYWTPDEKFDWAPATDRLYHMWLQKMTGSAAALPADTAMDVQLVILWMGDNEALRGNEQLLSKGFSDAYTTLVKRIRSDLVANKWTTLDESQIPIIIPGVHSGYPSSSDPTFDSVNFCNTAMQSIANNDPYITWLDPESWSTLKDENQANFLNKPTEANHYGAKGYVSASQDIMDAFQRIAEDPFDAFDIDDAISVDEARRRVRLYYGRSKSGTDIDDNVLLLHLNASMLHCFNLLGDNAWWLRRIEDLYLDAGANKKVTLPQYVHRLMKIEDPADLQYPLRFEQLGHVDGGKLQILMQERGQGTYVCHFITLPKELTQGDQMIPCPRNIAEWVVVETCARLSGSSTNAALAGFFAGESRRLEDSARRSVSHTQRTKRDRMKTVRRYPTLGYRRSHYQLWANDNSR